MTEVRSIGAAPISGEPLIRWLIGIAVLGFLVGIAVGYLWPIPTFKPGQGPSMVLAAFRALPLRSADAAASLGETPLPPPGP